MSRRGIRDLAQALVDWGVSFFTASDPTEADAGRRVDVYVPGSENERIHVGELRREGGEFVFRYAPAMRDAVGAPRIAGFPHLSETYRSKTLFPFFTVRLPPHDRPDVQRVLQERGIEDLDPLRLLGELASRTPISPFEFQFVDDAELCAA